VIVSSTDSTEKPAVYRKPQADVYTVLLVIALLAIIVSCVFLCLYMADYNWIFKGPKVSLQGGCVAPTVLSALSAAV
jgi:uncharacterized integral membrane protein